MKSCMFHCVDDDLDSGDHWDMVCRGNPDIKLEDRSISQQFEDCKISQFCTRPNEHSEECN